jgi:hypothetical protein
VESVCTEFELPYEAGASNAQLVRALHDFLLAKFAANQPVVLVLDEAQNLPVEAFEQLRMIGNLEADDAKLMQVAIVGQPELQRLFQSTQLRQLRQRIFRSFHLPALDRKATEGYIRYRLSVAAASDLNVFNSAAIDRVHAFSGGLPRLINAACDNAMLGAYSADRRRIDADYMDSVITQMMPTGITAPRERRELPPSPPSPRPAPPAVVQRAAVAPTELPVPIATSSARDAAAGQAALESLAQRTREIVIRGEGIARGLQEREDRLGNLSRHVQRAAVQLCDLLARLQSASAESRRERRAADEARERLAAQSRQARRLNEAITTRSRTSPIGQRNERPAALMKAAQLPVGALQQSPVIAATLDDSDDLHCLLHQTQESLADLRRLIKR